MWPASSESRRSNVSTQLEQFEDGGQLGHYALVLLIKQQNVYNIQ
jgi:hypothetical protein